MAEASQGMKTGDISDARDSEDEEEIRYNGAQRGAVIKESAVRQKRPTSGYSSATDNVYADNDPDVEVEFAKLSDKIDHILSRLSRDNDDHFADNSTSSHHVTLRPGRVTAPQRGGALSGHSSVEPPSDGLICRVANAAFCWRRQPRRNCVRLSAPSCAATTTSHLLLSVINYRLLICHLIVHPALLIGQNKGSIWCRRIAAKCLQFIFTRLISIMMI